MANDDLDYDNYRSFFSFCSPKPVPEKEWNTKKSLKDIALIKIYTHSSTLFYWGGNTFSLTLSTFKYVYALKPFSKLFSCYAKCDERNQLYEEVSMFLHYLTVVCFYGSIDLEVFLIQSMGITVPRFYSTFWVCIS